MTRNTIPLQDLIIREMSANGTLPDDLEKAYVEYVESGRAALVTALLEWDLVTLQEVTRDAIKRHVVEHYRRETEKIN